jgi:cysteinyl-tRNA synthetase
MNITDVGHLTDDADAGDDKIERSAIREGKTAWEVAAFYTEAYLRDLDQLNVERPTHLPRATDHIADMVALIERLEQRGFTYRTSDGIYFDTSQLTDYGQLAGLSSQDRRAGARVAVNPAKRHPADFALWKFSAVRSNEASGLVFPSSILHPPSSGARQMEWSSPWGVGFPGWHIECSAMSTKYLGQPFDIHTGGIEHIPIHHSNEIAQSEAATGQPLARYWLHNEHLIFDGGKMAKSVGNVTRLADVVERGYDPLAFRLLCLGTHYRHPLNFSWAALGAAQHQLSNLREAVARLSGESGIVPPDVNDQFLRSISDDLNTPQALAIFHEVLGSLRSDAEKLAVVQGWDRVFGLNLMSARRPAIPTSIQVQLTEYEAARRARDFGRSDQLRVQFEQAGYRVEDQPDGSSRLFPRD